jgi:flavodoxin I
MEKGVSKMKTIIVFTSMTGNTELMARTIADEFTKSGFHVELKDALEVDPAILQNYDNIMIGSYTWGDGDLPDEIMNFFEELKEVDLTGKTAAVFGPGDSSYQHFARAVDLFEELLKDQGCYILASGLKIDTVSEVDIQEKCILFARRLKIC